MFKAPQLLAVSQQRCLDLFDCIQDRLLELVDRLFLPRILDLDVGPNATTRQNGPPHAGHDRPELARRRSQIRRLLTPAPEIASEREPWEEIGSEDANSWGRRPGLALPSGRI